jgi:hypothetical protein
MEEVCRSQQDNVPFSIHAFGWKISICLSVLSGLKQGSLFCTLCFPLIDMDQQPGYRQAMCRVDNLGQVLDELFYGAKKSGTLEQV